MNQKPSLFEPIAQSMRIAPGELEELCKDAMRESDLEREEVPAKVEGED